MRKLFEAQFNGFPLQQEWNCLEAWTADAELPSGDPTLVWGCSGTEITGTVDTIGGGDDNSDLIIAGCSETPSAVRAARQTFGTLSDWYLPTGIELQAMYAQRSIISDFATGIKTYWTSSEHDATTAYYMDGGAVAAGAKTGERYARPIRKVSGNYEIGDTGPAGGIIFYKRQAEPTHKLSIYDTTLAEDGSSQDITLEAPGYAINWNGNVNDIVGGGIIESSAEFTVRSIDGILSDFMDDLASSIEGRFLVEIQKKTVLTETWEGSWKGILMTDFSGRKDIPDEPISFQATDGMALLDAIEVTATASELMLVTILKGLAQIPTVSLFSALSETRFLWVKTDWFADNIPADEEPLYQIGLYGKSLWVKKEEKKGYSGTIATIVSPMTYKEIIQHICERFNCILMMQQGSWYLFQRDLMEEDTITFETYKSAESLGTWRTNPWTYTVETYKELDQDNRYRSEGEFYSLPGIKSAEVIYGGGALADGSDSLIPTAWEPDEVYTTMPLYTGTGNYLHIRASFTEHFLIDWVGGTPPEQYFKARAEYKLIVTCGSYYLNAYTKGWTLDSSVADLVLSSTYLYHRYDSESDTWSFIDQALFNLDLITDDLPTDDEVIFELSRYQIQIFSGGTYFTCDIADDFLFTPDLDNHFMLFIVGDENPVSYVTFKAENPTAGFQLEYDRGESLFGTARVIMNRVIGYNNAGGELWNKGYTSTKTMYFNQLLVQQILANQIKGLLSFSGTIYERSENWLQLRHAIELTVNGTTYRLVFNNVTYVAQTESWQGDWVEISNTKGLAIPPLNENEFGIDDKPFIPRPPGPIFEDVLEELYDLESGNVDVTQGGNSTGGVITNRTTFVKQPALPSTPTMGTMAIGLAEIGIMKQFDALVI